MRKVLSLPLKIALVSVVCYFVRFFLHRQGTDTVDKTPHYR